MEVCVTGEMRRAEEVRCAFLRAGLTGLQLTTLDKHQHDTTERHNVNIDTDIDTNEGDDDNDPNSQHTDSIQQACPLTWPDDDTPSLSTIDETKLSLLDKDETKDLDETQLSVQVLDNTKDTDETRLVLSDKDETDLDETKLILSDKDLDETQLSVQILSDKDSTKEIVLSSDEDTYSTPSTFTPPLFSTPSPKRKRLHTD